MKENCKCCGMEVSDSYIEYGCAGKKGRFCMACATVTINPWQLIYFDASLKDLIEELKNR